MTLTEQFRAELFSDDDYALRELASQPNVVVIDQLASQRKELNDVRPRIPADIADEEPRWAWYPWRHTMVRTLGPTGFRRLRLDRNRNKLTLTEQERVGSQRIGVIGLSVGHSIAHTLALEGLCGMLRLADFDSIELSNLNRIPATLLDLGVNKAIVTARRIAEIDPYMAIEVNTRGVTPETVGSFLDGLDLVIEECDSLDVKLLVREAARDRRLPVLMETSDRGLLDVERFDLEPQRPLFHGLVGDLTAERVRGLNTRDKVPFVLRILEPAELSAPMAASMAEIDHEVTTWPQLGGDVTLGAATAAAAVRRLGRGLALPSGRIRVDLDDALNRLGVPPGPPRGADRPAGAAEPCAPVPAPLAPLVAAASRAPSGGNAQPWRLSANSRSDGTHELVIAARPERRSRMDVAGRATLVALGAAVFNARAAAAAHGMSAELDLVEQPEVTARLIIDGRCADEQLASWYPGVLGRCSNRQPGDGTPLRPAVADQLRAEARACGGWLGLLDGGDLAEATELLARADRVRFLDADLHREMFAELRFPGDAEPDWGIELAALELDAAELAKLEVSRRRDVMDQIAAWGGGVALGDMARDRIPTSSALAVLAAPLVTTADYLHAGEMLQRVWVSAQGAGLAVQPWSPLFLYAQGPDDLAALVSAPYLDETAALARRLWALASLPESARPVLVLRLSIAAPPTAPSRREWRFSPH